MADSLLYYNGVNAVTGDYALSPRTLDSLSAQSLPEPSPAHVADLTKRKQQTDGSDGKLATHRQDLMQAEAELQTLLRAQTTDCTRLDSVRRRISEHESYLSRNTHAGVRQGVNPCDLSQAGWGVILPARTDGTKQAAILEALEPLLTHRSQQAGAHFRKFLGGEGFRTGDTKARFLSRHGASPAGPADPDLVPYYLLLVGSPEEIPFEFQYHLDIQYAVGRLFFESIAEYHNYARSVVDAETRGSSKPQRMCLFGVQNPGDPATERTQRLLVSPLADSLQNSQARWQFDRPLPAQTTQSALAERLGGRETPALLFTACHGIELPTDHPLQRRRQGALLSNQWSRSPGTPIAEDSFFAAEHLASSADVQGMIVFAFSCFSAGAPRPAEYPYPDGSIPSTAASAPFVGALPMALLGHPRGGALAVIGHVERAWGYAYGVEDPRQRAHTAVFQSTIERLLLGHPVGYAMEFFNEHYAERTTALSELVFQILNHRKYDPAVLGELWMESADSRGYVVLGDPAARLSFAPAESKAQAAPSEILSTTAAPNSIPCPEEITADTWQQTPLAVQRLVDELKRKLATR